MQDIGFLMFLAVCWWAAGLCGAGYQYARWQACAGADARVQRRRHRWRALVWSLTGLGAVIFASGSCEYGWWDWPRTPRAWPTTPSSVDDAWRRERRARPARLTPVSVVARPRLIRGASVGTVRRAARLVPRQGEDQHDDVRSTHDGDDPAA